jgi:hypothetical protein
LEQVALEELIKYVLLALQEQHLLHLELQQ